MVLHDYNIGDRADSESILSTYLPKLMVRFFLEPLCLVLNIQYFCSLFQKVIIAYFIYSRAYSNGKLH